MTVYTVKKGDTLGKVAYEFYGTYEKWRTLAEYNDLIRPDLISVGDVIELPPWEPQVYRWPLERVEKEYYHFGDLYRVGHWKGRPHPGLDLHQYQGAEIHPIGEGIVIRNRLDPTGYGWYVMVKHGSSLWSLYAHLAAASQWPEDAQVGPDDVLGFEGTSGAAGIPHLHLEVKRTSENGLYPRLTLHNLIDWYYDPALVIGSVNYLCRPVQCWGCPRCS